MSKAFAGIKALNNVQLELREGEIHALMGENGAGKSTLMKILAGVYEKDEGTILLHNEDTGQLETVEMKSPLMAQNLGISMVFQEQNLLENMSVAENIFIGREPLTKMGFLDKDKLYSNATKELGKIELEIKPDAQLQGLSTGQMQSIEIAKALSFQARVVIFDEPTASLSEKESQILFDIINNLKKQGVCIVYISHRMEEVFQLSDRITVFRNGQYVDTKYTKDVSEAELIHMMIGREIEQVQANSQVERGSKDKTPIFEIRNVRAFPTSKPISFKLYEREILGFFGLVGAGRTELMRKIFGIDAIEEGEIYIKGKRIEMASPGSAINNGIGLIPEDRKELGLIQQMSIKDNMLISKIGQFKSGWLKTNELKDITGNYITDLGIVLRDENQEVKELSGGNQQKVVISKWLAMQPDILIMDEPTR
ncbi:MAG: sugar ABC transporter ATP-binding protein, partial [Clostridiaceae bacterium]|nr:sugar ABC transporter ATP-binding protein [Clostridiaceae bacterium]